MRGAGVRSLGWMMVLGACVAGYLVLSFHVSSVKSKVHLAEREIIALEREKILLETEFQSRANQQQLANWNRVEFGYQPPGADQYLETERELAGLGEARPHDAPAPIRVARPELESEEDDSGLLAMVSPLTGKPMEEGEQVDKQPAPKAEKQAEEKPAAKQEQGTRKPAKRPSLADRLSREIQVPDPAARMGQ